MKNWAERRRKRTVPGVPRRPTLGAIVLLIVLVTVVLLLSTGCPNDLSQAEKAERAGDLTTAVSLYKERLNTGPEDLKAIEALAAIFYVQQDWDEALPMQEKAVALDPKEAQIRVELGFNYLNHQNNPAGAVTVLKQAVGLQPSAKNMTFLAQAYAASGDQASAEAELRRAINADAGYGHAYAVLVGLLEKQGRTADAVEARNAAESAGVDLALSKGK